MSYKGSIMEQYGINYGAVSDQLRSNKESIKEQ